VPAWPGGIGQQRCEPLDPAVDRDMVDLDAALGEQLFDVAIGQAEAQIPADRNDDDVGREAETGEGGACRGRRAQVARSHIGSLAARRWSQRTQHRLSRSLAVSPPASRTSSWIERQSVR
jgi:hypothetical protein